MSESLPSGAVRRLCGFGRTTCADGYVLRPESVEAAQEVLSLAQRAGRNVVLRGAGRSYGDASLLPEAVVIDTCDLARILAWSPDTGRMVCEPGVTLEDICRRAMGEGWWLPVVSGTMKTTVGGALAMNIHGKNAFRAGPFGCHVSSIEVLLPTGRSAELRSSDPAFRAVVGSAGLLGLITKAEIQLKRVLSGRLRVTPISCRNWNDQFRAFEERADEEYCVSWIDGMARGPNAGRGLFHSARHEEAPHAPSLDWASQQLPARIAGLVPKSTVWRVLRLFNNDPGMRLLNSLKHLGGKRGSGRPYLQSLAEFSFLLDYVPHWELAYGSGGFIQYQSFVPSDSAQAVFESQVGRLQSEGTPSYLCVLKRHRPDEFLFSHGVEGFSLALDIKVPAQGWSHLERVCHALNDEVLQAGGRFYLAKDSTLRATDFARSLGEGAIEEFFRWKREFDPEGVLSSSLARRLGLEPIRVQSPRTQGAM